MRQAIVAQLLWRGLDLYDQRRMHDTYNRAKRAQSAYDIWEGHDLERTNITVYSVTPRGRVSR
jgi:hypothetical protein